MELPLWRLVMAGVCTMQDLETTWGWDDVVRANALLDYREAIETALIPDEKE